MIIDVGILYILFEQIVINELGIDVRAEWPIRINVPHYKFKLMMYKLDGLDLLLRIEYNLAMKCLLLSFLHVYFI